MMDFFNLKRQYKEYQKEIDHAIQGVLESCQFIMGSQIQELEKTLAHYVGVKHCLLVSSASTGLLLALEALGIGPGDEVITVPFTWISPVEAIRKVGATPVFVDIEPNTCIINAQKIEEAITPRTKAILPVSLFGGLPDFPLIHKIAQKYGLVVLEDAAQSFGAEQDGKKSCALSTIGVTSFFPTKPLGCYGDGGAVFTDRDDLAQKIDALRTHGAKIRFHHQYIGMNGRMDTIQAAIVLAKFPFFQEELKVRNEIYHYYTKRLDPILETLQFHPKTLSAHALYTLQSDNRKEILIELEKEKIPYSIYYPKCIHEQPAYLDLGYVQGDFPEAERAVQRIFSIPINPWLEKKDLDKILDIIEKSLARKTCSV